MASNFTVYNASAGSGKTYTIVKEYLKIILSSESPYKYQNILAITFTNKAAAEMKDRIFMQLIEFGAKDANNKPSAFLLELEKELGIDKSVILKRAKRVSSEILHDYSKFNISTIDKFTHKLIRTFSFDLNLSMNFDVALDISSYISDAVDALISKIGQREELTNAILKFALRKLNEGKSWDISFLLKEMSSELFKEESIEEIEKLKNYTISDFIDLASLLRELRANKLDDLKKIGEKALNLVDAKNIEYKMFAFGDLPKYFDKCNKGIFSIEPPKRLGGLFEKGMLYSKKNEKKSSASDIDEIFDSLHNCYNKSLEWVVKNGSLVILMELILKNIDSTAVLNEIDRELNVIKQNNNILFNTEFNKLISNEISMQPVPYIYERIGEKYKYFFVDEFQDTSILQWTNLIPLIENAVSQGGRCVIVGDAKQAIYRWRGGKADQFIDLSQKKVNFPFEITPATLNKNYRSYSQIINFSNDFFKFTANTFGLESYKEMYIEGNNQKTNDKNGGYVEIEFVDKNDGDLEFLNNSKTKKIIENLLEEGYSLSDICILTRNTKEGIILSKYLIEQKIEVISKESLLIKNAPEVDFCIQILKLINSKTDFDARLKVIEYLIQTNKIPVQEKDRHDIYVEFINMDAPVFFYNLKKYQVDFNLQNVLKKPLYDAVESIIRSFDLSEEASSEIQFFLDFVLDFSTKNNTGINVFLEHWEDKKDKLSLIIPDGLEAIQIMTIHKSKGLEFPIVIFPYANWMTTEIKAKTWIDISDNKDTSHKIKNAVVPINKDLSTTNIGKKIYEKHENDVKLDNLNLLYVAITRAEQRLYIITYKDSRKKLSNYFIEYLDSKSEYITKYKKEKDNTFSFGEKIFVPTHKKKSAKNYHLKKLNSYKWTDRIEMSLEAPKYWNIGEMTENEYGNLIHNILSGIIYKDDVEKVINDFAIEGNIEKNNIEKIKILAYSIVNHPDIKEYFSEKYTVKNEQDIILKSGEVFRPDRVSIFKKNAVIIDYKTGNFLDAHIEQVNTYGHALKELGYNIECKLLVYIKDNIEVMTV